METLKESRKYNVAIRKRPDSDYYIMIYGLGCEVCDNCFVCPLPEGCNIPASKARQGHVCITFAEYPQIVSYEILAGG